MIFFTSVRITSKQKPLQVTSSQQPQNPTINYGAAHVVEVNPGGYGFYNKHKVTSTRMKTENNPQRYHELHSKSVFLPYVGKDWHGTDDPFYFYVYSAIYDDRKKFGIAHVALIGIADTSKFNINNIKCRMLFSDNKGGLDSSTSYGLQALTKDFNKDGVQVSAFVIWCPLQGHGANRKPTEVILKLLSNNTIVDLSTRQVEYPDKPEEKQSLGVCVSAIYSPMSKYDKPLDPRNIIEWIEMQRILGVIHFSIYIHSIETAVLRVLQYYANLGILTIRSIGPINGDMYKMPRITSLADCMYRYMDSHHKVLVLDFDEVIMPQENVTLMEMLHSAVQLEEATVEGTHFQFQNMDFYTDDPKIDTSKPEYMRLLHHRHHAPPDPFKGPMKSIQDPQTCVFSSNNFCFQTLLAAKTVYVNSSLALSYHYKDCILQKSSMNCSGVFKSTTIDDILLRYEHILVPHAEQIMQYLRLDHE